MTQEFNCDCCRHLRLAEFDEVLVGGPRWQASDIQVGLTQLLCSSLAAAVGAWAGRSHGMRGWSIGLLGKKSEKEPRFNTTNHGTGGEGFKRAER